MAHPFQLLPSTTTSTEPAGISVIDVELEAEEREKIRTILISRYIYIPEKYYARMTQSRLHEQFANFIDIQSRKLEQIKEKLNEHNISIPAAYYHQMVEDNLMESILKVAQDVDNEEEIFRRKHFSSIFDEPHKRQHDDMDEKQSKRQKTSYDNGTKQTIINSSPTANTDNEDQSKD